MNRLQSIQTEIWKYKAVRKYKTQPGKVSTCRFCFCYLYQYSIKLYQANPTQLVSKIILDTFDLSKHLAIK